MKSLVDFLSGSFKADPQDWEAALRAELKLDDLKGKTSKRTPEGTWPTLLTQSPRAHYLVPQESWKRAAQSYILLPQKLEEVLQDDLANGVRSFFFLKDHLRDEQWQRVEETLGTHPDAKDLRVFLLGKGGPRSSARLKLIDSGDLLSGEKAHREGGSHVQELAELLLQLIQLPQDTETEVYLGLYTGSDLFRSIAKLRAARLLAQRVLQELGSPRQVYLCALTSFRDWTLYERYANMLRNVTSVTAGLMAGADFIQSTGYMGLLELEAGETDPEHLERSRRMARNTSHVLALESMLSVIEDPGFGSFQLEALTENFASSAWALMQEVLTLPEAERAGHMLKLAHKTQTEREKGIRSRRQVITGVNDFPDAREALGVRSLPLAPLYRSARTFENLRVMMELAPAKPRVEVLVWGDAAVLSARVNFARNYFELLGLDVKEVHLKSIKDGASSADILVLCAADADYSQFSALGFQQRWKFVAGKSELTGFGNIFAGQDVIDVLWPIVQHWSGR
jgi:hypothetical protein